VATGVSGDDKGASVKDNERNINGLNGIWNRRYQCGRAWRHGVMKNMVIGGDGGA